MTTSVYTACPLIETRIEISAYNVPQEYKCADGTTYQYWQHFDPDGNATLVQFCQKAGRKRDVFECLNENEWAACSYRRPLPKGRLVMTCPNPDCHIEMDETWHADIVYADVTPPQTFRYWECCRCHQFVMVEL